MTTRSVTGLLGRKLSMLPIALAMAAIAAVPRPAIAGAESGRSPLAAKTGLASADRQLVVTNISAAAEQRYADPAAGARIARHIRARLAAGAYENALDPVAFADALTTDMRSVVNDVHLNVVFEGDRGTASQPVRVPMSQGAPGNRPILSPDSSARFARTNFGFDAVERLSGNVGYLRLSEFVPLSLSGDTAASALAFLANTDALIIDLRGVPGGSPDLAARLASYFTGPDPLRLMASQNRATNTISEHWATAEVPGRKLTGKPLYVLTNRSTASAAEMLGYFVQRHKLGTLVGEQTAGAGNGGNVVPVGAGFAFFLPQNRIIDGPGWEGVGLKPDIEARARDAQAVAHEAALRALIDRDRSDGVRREREWALDALRAAAVVTSPAEAAAYVGAFGQRTFLFEDGQLVAVAPSGRRDVLRALGGGRFQGQRTRFTFHREGTALASAVDVETIDGVASRLNRSTAN